MDECGDVLFSKNLLCEKEPGHDGSHRNGVWFWNSEIELLRRDLDIQKRLATAVIADFAEYKKNHPAEIDRLQSTVNELAVENAELRAALDLERSRRTLGGTPPPPDENWANKVLPPPESATTGPVAPPGMARSDDHLRRRT